MVMSVWSRFSIHPVYENIMLSYLSGTHWSESQCKGRRDCHGPLDETTKPGKWLGSLLSVFLSALTPVIGDWTDTSPRKPIQISSTVLFWDKWMKNPRGSWLTKAHWTSKSRQLSRHWTFPLKTSLWLYQNKDISRACSINWSHLFCHSLNAAALSPSDRLLYLQRTHAISAYIHHRQTHWLNLEKSCMFYLICSCFKTSIYS